MIEENIHRALSSPTRREILFLLGKDKMYLTEIAAALNKAPQTIDFHMQILEKNGIVRYDVEEGKKFYKLKDKKILRYLEGPPRPIPFEHRSKPPHEIILDVRDELSKRMERIEEKLDLLLKKENIKSKHDRQ